MRCSNCGKQVPDHGNVCPWCKIDKTPDKMIQGTTNVLGLLGGIVGLILGAAADAWFGGLILGVIAGMVAGQIIGTKNADQYRKIQRERAAAADHARMTQQASYIGNATATAFHYSAPTVSPSAPPVVDVAGATRQQEAGLLASGDYRKCPHCAELIKAEAKVCRFCRLEVAVPIGAGR